MMRAFRRMSDIETALLSFVAVGTAAALVLPILGFVAIQAVGGAVAIGITAGCFSGLVRSVVGG